LLQCCCTEWEEPEVSYYHRAKSSQALYQIAIGVPLHHADALPDREAAGGLLGDRSVERGGANASER